MSKARGVAIVVSALAALGGTAATMLAECNAEPALRVEVEHVVKAWEVDSVPVVVDPGAIRVTGSSAAPVIVPNVAPNTRYSLHVDGDFLADSQLVDTNEHGQGLALLQVVRLDRDPPAPGHERWAELDARDPDALALAWYASSGLVERTNLPTDAVARYRHINASWVRLGVHRKADDNSRDLMIVKVAADTPVEAIGRTIELILEVTRPIATSTGVEEREAFEVSVRLARAGGS